jgi:hypothetical protein
VIVIASFREFGPLFLVSEFDYSFMPCIVAVSTRHTVFAPVEVCRGVEGYVVDNPSIIDGCITSYCIGAI